MDHKSNIFKFGIAISLLYSGSVYASPYKTGWRPMPEEHVETINNLHQLRKIHKEELRNTGKILMKSVRSKTPDTVDLSPVCTVLDQGNLGSCVINAFSGSVHALQVLDRFKREGGKIGALQTKAKVKLASGIISGKMEVPHVPSSLPKSSKKPLEIVELKSKVNGGPDISLIKKQTPFFSRLFGYRDVIGMQGDVSDTGTDAGTAFLSYNRGWSYETTSPYEVERFSETPTKIAFTEAALNASKVRVNVALIPREEGATSKIESLLSAGKFVMIAINVFESFESEMVAKTGIVSAPKKGEKLKGGHEMTIVGYDRTSQRVLVKNSWGKNWGLGGYCWIPYALISNPKFTLELMEIKLATDV